MPKPPALDPGSIELLAGKPYPAPFDAATEGLSKRRLTTVLGLTQFGVNITELEPGSATALRHWHSHEDEFVYVLEGEVTLVTDAGEQTLGPGMCAGFPAGTPDGHCLQNRSGLRAVIIEVGSRDNHDECHYSDDDLFCRADRYEAAVFTRKDGSPLD